MDNLIINPKIEIERIVDFIQNTLEKTGFKKVVVGVSGGIDSAVVLALCVKALGKENVMALLMPYGEMNGEDRKNLEKLFELLKLPEENRKEIDIVSIVDNFKFLILNFKSNLNNKFLNNKNKNELIRLGNVMARVRMMVLFDLAKQHNVLVCGTENKSEYLLGYYTRFGDEASDLEPIRHLYKTEVYQLSKYLDIPEQIINKKPTAGLWEGQTDYGELGFTYNEADEIIYQVFDKKIAWEDLRLKVKGKKLKASNEIINKIRKRVERNWFKKEVPYKIEL